MSSRLFICLFIFVNFNIFSQEVYRLDNAIQYFCNQLESEIKQNSSVAIVNFDSPSEKFSSYVINELTNLLLKNKKLVVTEQQKLDLVRKNEQYQLSGNVSDETMVRIGHNIGAQYIISGYLIDLGTTYRIGIFAINMEKATRTTSAAVYLSGFDDQVVFLVTGTTKRPSEKTIAPSLTLASSKAAFMQSSTTIIGNTLINRIPRNSKIAIIMPDGFVAGDYFKNELDYVLNNSNKFNVIKLKDIDIVLSKMAPGNMSGQRSDEQWKEIGKLLGVNVILQGLILDSELADENGKIFFSETVLQIRVVYASSLQEITKLSAYWKWDNGKEIQSIPCYE